MAKRLLVRSGLLLGAVYYTKQLGVWDSQHRTDRLYNDIKDGVRPHLQELESKLPFEVPALPPKGEVRYLIKHYYNQGVKGTFHFIVMLPCYTGQLLKKVKDVSLELFEKVVPATGPIVTAPEDKCKPAIKAETKK